MDKEEIEDEVRKMKKDIKNIKLAIICYVLLQFLVYLIRNYIT